MQLSLPFGDAVDAVDAVRPDTGLAAGPPAPDRPERLATPVPSAGEPASPRTPPVPAPADLSELEAWLRQVGGASRKASDMRSALRAVARVLDCKLNEISTDPAKLGPMLADSSPALAGLTSARWTRVKSLTLTALTEAGIKVMPGRDVGGLAPPWKALADALPDKAARTGLSRLMSYMSREGIAPSQVTAGAIEQFGDALRGASLHRNPDYTYRSSVRRWNAVVGLVPGWPAVVVQLEPDRRKYALPRSDFPSSFTTDVDAFLSNSGDPDPFGDAYAPAVRPSTIALRRKQIYQVASALVASGLPIEELTSLATLVAPENARAALRLLLARKVGQTTPHLGQQARLLQTIARHWVRDPQASEAATKFSQRLQVKSCGMVEKNRTRLRQFDLPENRAAFLHLPARVFAEERREKHPSVGQAQRLMLALAVEILTVAPMRVGNLTQIEIDRHLLKVRQGKNRRYHIVFAPHETKTNEPFEMELPSQSVALLEAYLRDYRGLLPGSGSSFLFPSPQGGMRSSVALSRAISGFVQRETGLVMHCHMFRQLAGKLYLDANPQDVETVRRVLGHRSTNTTLRSYARLRSDHAFRRYDEIVAAQREANPPAQIRRKSSSQVAPAATRELT